MEKTTQTVTLPRRVLEQVLRVSSDFETLQGELEDYLIASQPALVNRLRRARREHLTGRVRPFPPAR